MSRTEATYHQDILDKNYALFQTLSRADIVPYNSRNDSYSEPIIDIEELWIRPSYEKGEHWHFYGGTMLDAVYEVIDCRVDLKGVSQVLLKVVDCFHYPHRIGSWAVYDLAWSSNGYAMNGTCSLRTRIK